MVCVATDYWTETNIANGLTALTICIEVNSRYLINELHAMFTIHSDGILRHFDAMGVPRF